MMENVCLIIDLDGFHVAGQFFCRECGSIDTRLGIPTSGMFDLSFVDDMASPKDRKTIWYCENFLHGLSLFPKPQEGEEKTLPYSEFDHYVKDLYARSVFPESSSRSIVAYKGGHVEKDLLERLEIPHLNLETYGCPKFERLPPNTQPDCGNHKIQLPNNDRYRWNNNKKKKRTPKMFHCPRQEVYSFYVWWKEQLRDTM